MGFFQLNFLNAVGSLVQKIHNARAIFLQFSDIKNGGRSKQSSVDSQLVTGEPQRTGISRPKESQSYLPINKFI